MRVLFVYPAQENFTVKPIGISLLMARMVEAGHEVDLFDTSFMDLGGENYNQLLTDNGIFKPVNWGCDVSKKKVNIEEELRKKVNDFGPDRICISALDDEIPTVRKIVAGVRKTTPARIWVGNNAAYTMYKSMEWMGLYFYTGEVLADFVWTVEKCTDRIVHSYNYYSGLDKLPYLYWDRFDDRHFLKAYDGKVYRGGDHMIGWGCTNSCTYCINKFWREQHGGMKGSIRRYSVKRIVSELAYLSDKYSLELWKFHDEDFLLKPVKYLKDLVQEYLMYVDLPFTCMVNAKSVTDRKAEMLKAMGCVSVSMGVETGNRIMREMLNRRESPEDIIDAVSLLQSYGIRVSAFNMIGLPYETEDTIKDTIELNKAAGIKHPNVSIYIPLKGTTMYDLSVLGGFYDGESDLKTNKPTLKFKNLSEEKLMYYFKNFKRLVTA